MRSLPCLCSFGYSTEDVARVDCCSSSLAFPVFAHGTSTAAIVLAMFLPRPEPGCSAPGWRRRSHGDVRRHGLPEWLPLTLDTQAWYFGQSLIVLSLIGALATYGFLVALGRRPAFGVMEAEAAGSHWSGVSKSVT